ncbi:Nsp1-like C-terminal region-domain-containing protein [Durotheca rogersii]|uniref:Nsp1-like C-terminal region-domain-containing protein n=1 Tax=Durotheca rogersii TaxID=419775 RepID=UPI00222073CC|nr:Nsp1-like C-terminal region-domain-containing protein [Durotheca rogersii]KAI5862092.1 Nsp1-like C-terminal region-domain-containing protein [Durotheca rogersii]
MSFSGGASEGQPNNATTSGAPASGGLFGSSTPTLTSNTFGSGGAGGSFTFGNLGGSNNTTTPTSTTPGSMFGNTASKPDDQKPKSFGGAAATTSSPAGALWGGTQTTPSTKSSIFPGAEPAQSTSLFGNTASTPTLTPANATAGGLFAAKDNKSSTPAAAGTPSSGLFGGGNAGSSGIFGGTGSSATPASNAPAPGTLSTPAKPTLPLNSTTPAGAPPSAAGKSASGLFGNTAPPQTTALFASPKQGEKKEDQPNSLFGATASSAPAGATASQPSSSSAPTATLFGQAPNPAPSIFGAKAAATKGDSAAPAATAGPLFSQQPTKPANAPSAMPSLFGGASATSGASTSSSSLFGQKTAPATSSGTPATTAPATIQSSSALFPNSNKLPSIAPTSEPAKTQLGALFGSGTPGSNTAAAEASKPTTSLFGGNTANATTGNASSTTTTATTSAAAPALGSTTNTTAPLGASSLFGAAKPSTSAAAQGAAAQPAAGTAAALGASTAGPTSSMARLKNKTMDEIITRWATDLSKYQKEFKDQAAQVAQWDRLLVDNGEKIQRLYLDTFEAEKGSREVERQLAAVEGQQEELEAWLDKYEGEVDALFGKQVGPRDQLAGPDQEREKTYKLAEKITERLDEMGRDLTKMIKEINDISSTLSKGNKPDDPLSQIVRVLNGHLSQLQWIDTNAAALQAKVAAAQKASSTVGSQYGGPEQDNVDSFYRSYMSRR